MRSIEVEVKGVKLEVSTVYQRGYCLVLPFDSDCIEKLKDISAKELVSISKEKVTPYIKYYNVCDYKSYSSSWSLDSYGIDESVYNDSLYVMDNFEPSTIGYKAALELTQRYEGTYQDTPEEIESKRQRKMQGRWARKKPIIKATLIERHGAKCMTCKKDLERNKLCIVYNGDLLEKGAEITEEKSIITCRSCINKNKK